MDLRNWRIKVFSPFLVIYWMALYLCTQYSQCRIVTGHTIKSCHFTISKVNYCRFQWPRGLRCGSAAVRLLGFWVRILLGAWMSDAGVVCCQAGVSASGWSLVQKRSTDSGVLECDRESAIMRRHWPTGGCWATVKKVNFSVSSTPPPPLLSPQIF